jgi:phosphoribosyl-AMP cyclohydrolase
VQNQHTRNRAELRQPLPPDLSAVKFDVKGLVPCVVQEWNTGQVLMLAYMNAESLAKTVETGLTWFYSRSRQTLWNKGGTSGNIQKVRELRYDCDGDTILALVEQHGPACHTGDATCFDGRWLGSPAGEQPPFLACREG